VPYLDIRALRAWALTARPIWCLVRACGRYVVLVWAILLSLYPDLGIGLPGEPLNHQPATVSTPPGSPNLFAAWTNSVPARSARRGRQKARSPMAQPD